MKFLPAFQTLSSIGFILLLAGSRGLQEQHWPPGRVVHVHPWIVFLSLALGFLTLVFWLAGPRAPALGPRLDRLMPLLAWGLLAAMVVMALFFPGPWPA